MKLVTEEQFVLTGGIRDRTWTEPDIMKNFLLILLIFAVGIFCGIGFNQWQSGEQSASGVNQPEKDDPSLEKDSPPVPMNEQILLERFLPETAPYWLYYDVEKFQKQKTSVNEFLEKPGVSRFWNEFCASLPQGVTPAFSELIESSKQMHLFVLPPREENPAPVMVAAFSLTDTTETIETPPGIASLIHHYPDSASSEMKVGDRIIHSIETPLGHYAYMQTKDGLLICNNRDALEQFWRQPPPAPPENKDGKDPYQIILKEHGDTVAALFVNIDYPGEPIPGALGYLTHRLRPLGVKRTAVLFEWKDDSGKMTVVAPGEIPVSWAENWLPLDGFPFGNDDPAGLVEAAFRWPGGDVSGSGTASAEKPDKNARPVPVEMKNDDREAKPGDSRNGMRERTRVNRAQGRGNRPSGMERRNRLNPGVLAQAQMHMLSRMVPAGKTVGLNFFGFFNDSPALTFALPDLDTGQSPVDMLKALPNVKLSTMEIAMLPATQLQFENNSKNRIQGLDHLVFIERDAVSYLFDTEENAESYLGNPSGSSNRSSEIRSQLEEIKNPAQIEIVLSRDFFRYILDMEKTIISGDFEYQEDLASLLDELYDFTKPMVLTGGLDEGQWFMETYSEDQIAHWVDTGLLLWSVKRFFED